MVGKRAEVAGDGAHREKEPLPPFVTQSQQYELFLARITLVGAELRSAITTILESVAGPRPRPTRLSNAIGLDKSLSSRLVRATRSASDLDLLHLVPSPAGLRILATSATRFADQASIANLLAAVAHFEELIDSEPGGRAAIDAQLSESSTLALEKRERIAKQASFKSMSFLLGYFCDVLTTTLFLVPSENGRRVDGIEVQRRVGLRRMRPSTPLPLLSVTMDREDAARENEIFVDTVGGGRASGPAEFLLPEFSTKPIPRYDVVRDGEITSLVLAGDPSVHAPHQLASAFCIRNGWPLAPEARVHALRGYVLHMPCRRLVRDVFVAESIFRDVAPAVSFVLPGARAAMRPPGQGGARHFTEVGLTATVVRLPDGPRAYEVPDVMNHDAAVRHVLEREGQTRTQFRGWRCSITYPVPLIEMMWWLEHRGHAE